MTRLRIGTRNSPLALWQARHVRERLLDCHPGLEVALHETLSTGDRNPDLPLAAMGGKGLFLKELEQSLLRGETDVAVHSVKDMTVTLADGLSLVAVCAREDARDALVANRFGALERLPRGAVVGTCSLRRQCQLRARHPHLRIVNLRGNVNTRLAKLDSGQYDAIVLAVAGLKRLRLEHRISEYLAPEICLPAAGQGAIGIQCRAGHSAALDLVKAVNHPDSAVCVAAERAVVAGLGGDCHLPLAAYAQLHESRITVRGLVGKLDGSQLLRSEKTGRRADAVAVGHEVAEDLLARGAADLLAGV